jgi:ABC-type polysaccharide/polyol phosphate transport system ATPase subunit
MAELIHHSDIMVLVSHDHELIKLLCNRVIWLDHGKLVQDGSPEQVIREYLKFKAYN